MSDLEQQRRDLKRDQPKLYEYIRALEIGKALDAAGDTASGSIGGHAAANRIWGMAHEYTTRARKMWQEEKG